jgi:PAS domain S-box-containing protein
LARRNGLAALRADAETPPLQERQVWSPFTWTLLRYHQPVTREASQSRIVQEHPSQPKESGTRRPDSDEALRQSEERFRLMVEAVKDYGIFLLDPTGHVASWNEGAERIKGYRADEIIGKHFSSFYPQEALDRGWPAYELEVAKQEGRFEDEGWRIRKDGSRFWANVIITALYAEDGRLVGFTKVTRDLTERKRQEEALRQSEASLEQANRELARKNRDLQEFAYVASHDLQEPLRKISAFAELLTADFGDTLAPPGLMYVDRIRDAAQRMTTLLRDLLTYSRVATRGAPFQPVNLNRIVEEVTSDLQILLEERQGQVMHEPLPEIEADPTQMRQLFQNLIGNALKFHREGVPPVVRITTETPRQGARAQDVQTIVVQDNGIGFDKQHLDRIFAPFQRLHTRREFEGAGLGLAICKRIMERHEGDITARSRPGEGATFIVTLPTRRPAAAADTRDS